MKTVLLVRIAKINKPLGSVIFISLRGLVSTLSLLVYETTGMQRRASFVRVSAENEGVETLSLTRSDEDNEKGMSAVAFDGGTTVDRPFYPADEETSGDPSAVPALPAATRYWRSRDSKELLSCLFFFFLCMLSTVIKQTTNQRPIPFQLLATGEYTISLTINEIFEGDTISDTLLIVLAIQLPLLLQLTAGKVLGALGDAHATLCIYIVAFGLTMMCTDLIKRYCGNLRPVFYDLCQPDAAYESCTTANEENAKSARLSFPSGHSSTSFCGLTLLSLFLHSRFGVPSINRRLQGQSEATTSSKDPLQYRLISLLALIPMGVALFIAASRVTDNRHFPADVVAGSVLGASIATFVHGLWLSEMASG